MPGRSSCVRCSSPISHREADPPAPGDSASVSAERRAAGDMPDGSGAGASAEAPALEGHPVRRRADGAAGSGLADVPEPGPQAPHAVLAFHRRHHAVGTLPVHHVAVPIGCAADSGALAPRRCTHWSASERRACRYAFHGSPPVRGGEVRWRSSPVQQFAQPSERLRDRGTRVLPVDGPVED